MCRHACFENRRENGLYTYIHVKFGNRATSITLAQYARIAELLWKIENY